MPDPRRKELPESLTRTVEMKRPSCLFLCPFFFQGGACSMSFRRIGDVRQHLGRRHLTVQHCPMCGFEPSNDTLLREHISARGCEKTSFRKPGLSADKWAAICAAARRPPHQVRGTDADRWMAIWDIIFPSSERPSSPYQDGSTTAMKLRFYAGRFLEEQKGWEAVAGVLPPWLHEVPHESRVPLYSNFARFLGYFVDYVRYEDCLGDGGENMSLRWDRTNHMLE